MTLAQRPLLHALIMTFTLGIMVSSSCAQTNGIPVDSQPEANDIRLPVVVSGASAGTWHKGNTKVTALRGGSDADGLAKLRQGGLQLRAQNLVIVERMENGVNDIRVYAEERVLFQIHGHWRNMGVHSMHIQSLEAVQVTAPIQSVVTHPDSLMKRAVDRIAPGDRTSATAVSLQDDVGPFLPPQFNVQTPNAGTTARQIQIRPRSSQPMQFESRTSRDTVPEEQVYIFTGGVNVLIQGLETDMGGNLIQPGVLDLSADRIVVWTNAGDADGLNPGGTGTIVQAATTKLQVYLEGDILVRQAGNTISATHAFFDANNDRALLLNAELRAFMPQNDGTFRVRAERLRQVSRNRFHAQNAWTTTSPYGKPGYRLQAADIFVEPGPTTPLTEIDPNTGLPKNGPPLWVTAVNSRLLIEDVPVLAFPKLTAPAEDPNIPIRRAVVKQDRIFGLQIRTVWNLSKILGRPKQPGTQWDLLADHLSKRGPSLGVAGNYDVDNLFGGAIGSTSMIWQLDQGTDNLGFDRKSLIPDQENRGQIIWRHKQQLPGDAMLFGEIGYISDRNYRESFHELQFDRDKDAETILGLRKDSGVWSGTLWARTELNEFEASTDWLPRGDVYAFSQPVLGGLAYWTGHSSAGYADLEPGRPPTDPADPFVTGALSGVADLNGVVAMTRHQLDAPFTLGPLSINPFVMGEAAFWDDGLMQNDVDRYLVSGGVRATLTATRTMPQIHSELWNLNGLSHRTQTSLEYRVTDVSRNLGEIGQYNEIDENSNERGRIRYTLQQFGGVVPAEFEPRFYAVRQGAGLWVSAPYHELAEDQQVVRLVTRQRLQTKVGPAGSQRLRDWMVMESGVSFFPDAARDNFGEDFGLIFSNYRWNLNDRTSLLAEGILDLFENSQDVWSVGVLSQRSTRGSVYFGYRQVKARNFLDSQTLVGSYSYRMSPKWISTGSVAYDVAAGESRGSSLTFSRIGLDWVLHIGFGIDTSKDNVGIAFALEPRFGPPSPTNMSYLLGLQQ